MRGEEVPATEQRLRENAMLEQLRIHEQILHDLALHYLEPLSGTYERLAYVAGLRDASTGRYVHESLSAVYGEDRVDEVLRHCHEEIFERLLETPLAMQEQELWRHMATLEGEPAERVQRSVQQMRDWVPAGAPDYLKELFGSNLAALTDLCLAPRTSARTDLK